VDITDTLIIVKEFAPRSFLFLTLLKEISSSSNKFMNLFQIILCISSFLNKYIVKDQVAKT